MLGAIRPALSENTIEVEDTWALARLLAVAVIVQFERVSQQSTMSPAASVSAGPEAARTCIVPSQR